MGALATVVDRSTLPWTPWHIDDREAPTHMGPFPDLSARSCEVRFTSMSRHCQNDRLRPKSANAQSRCATARCAGARAERPVADGEDSDSGLPRSTRVLSACNA